ncbi:hypothetical protein DSO57_1031045 [Entomophthora muscae]|uniref:Uncharacterized protein n=1 Tax=Entomophthora muscae TaxID=34485 RepID=A0ACC2TMV1_9FUNG|nr:hypothetical protein DSO57_1031045 [Entomophthora muscae]
MPKAHGSEDLDPGMPNNNAYGMSNLLGSPETIGVDELVINNINDPPVILDPRFEPQTFQLFPVP